MFEVLAAQEHDRFVRERLREGWHYAPGPKDEDKQTSPSLVPWEELPDHIKKIDRDTFEDLPAALASAGFELFRLEGQAEQ